MATYYGDFADYLEANDIKLSRLEKIRQIKDALYDAMLRFSLKKPEVEEYHFNDGQTIIRTKYRSIAEMQNAIDALTKDEQRLINSNTGHVIGGQHGDSYLNR